MISCYWSNLEGTFHSGKEIARIQSISRFPAFLRNRSAPVCARQIVAPTAKTITRNHRLEYLLQLRIFFMLITSDRLCRTFHIKNTDFDPIFLRRKKAWEETNFANLRFNSFEKNRRRPQTDRWRT